MARRPGSGGNRNISVNRNVAVSGGYRGYGAAGLTTGLLVGGLAGTALSQPKQETVYVQGTPYYILPNGTLSSAYVSPNPAIY